MLFTTILAAFALLFLPVLAMPQGSPGHPPAVRVAYSGQYDNKKLSLNGVACSNGPNGLITKGYHTLGDLKNFPYVAGTQYVNGWNSPNCGSCWKLTYGSKSVNVLAVDHVAEGFIVSKAAMDKLTGGQSLNLGHVQGAAQQVANSECQI